MQYNAIIDNKMSSKTCQDRQVARFSAILQNGPPRFFHPSQMEHT